MRLVRSRGLAVVPSLTLAVLLSACAQSQQSYRPHSYAGAYSHSGQVATAIPPRIVIEDDGLPMQHPPRLRRGAAPDDPAEPFSPNYGPPPRNAPAKPRVKEVHAGLKPRRPLDPDFSIARAITEHEMRTR